MVFFFFFLNSSLKYFSTIRDFVPHWNLVVSGSIFGCPRVGEDMLLHLVEARDDILQHTGQALCNKDFFGAKYMWVEKLHWKNTACPLLQFYSASLVVTYS